MQGSRQDGASRGSELESHRQKKSPAEKKSVLQINRGGKADDGGKKSNKLEFGKTYLKYTYPLPTGQKGINAYPQVLA